MIYHFNAEQLTIPNYVMILTFFATFGEMSRITKLN